jgi:outer membrane immunogenic protein
MRQHVLALLGAASLAIGGISVTKAADIPRKAPAPVVVAPACAQFGGWYIGIQGGGISQRHDFTDVDNFFGNNVADHFATRRSSGFVGPQAGWNWQWNCTVFGLQADWSWTGGTHEHSFSNEFFDAHVNSKTKWFATIRARSGVVVNNLLLYVTGGFAFANNRREHLFVDHVEEENFIFTHNKTRFGLAVGAGTEWSFGNNWSLGTEFLYMAFERDRRAFTCPLGTSCAGDTFRFEHLNDAWIARISLNYRFGGGGGGGAFGY